MQDNYNGWAFEGYNLEAYKAVFKRVFKRVFNEKSKIIPFGTNSLLAAEKFSAKKNVKNFIQMLKN